MESAIRQDYVDSFMKRLFQLYQKQLYCDIELKTSHKSLYVHKIVLIGASDFLKVNLDSITSEDTEIPKLVILDIDWEILSTVVTFIYTGILDLSKANVDQIAQAATVLQLESAKQLCLDFNSTAEPTHLTPPDRHSVEGLGDKENELLHDVIDPPSTRCNKVTSQTTLGDSNVTIKRELSSQEAARCLKTANKPLPEDVVQRKRQLRTRKRKLQTEDETLVVKKPLVNEELRTYSRKSTERNKYKDVVESESETLREQHTTTHNATEDFIDSPEFNNGPNIKNSQRAIKPVSCTHCTKELYHKRSLVGYRNRTFNKHLPFLSNKLNIYRQLLIIKQCFKQRVHRYGDTAMMKNEEVSFGLAQMLQADSQPEVFVCCASSFKSLAMFKIHHRRKHKTDKVFISKRIKCSICLKKNKQIFSCLKKDRLSKHLDPVDVKHRHSTVHKSRSLKTENKSQSTVTHEEESLPKTRKTPLRCQESMCRSCVKLYFVTFLHVS